MLRIIDKTTANPKPIVNCPAEGLFELRNKRTRTAKSFLLKSGLHRQIITIGHQHYWNGLEWLDIDNRVAKTEFGYECTETSYFWLAHQTGIGCNYKSRTGGFSRMKLLSVGGNSVVHSEPEAEDNCLHYNNIALDTDFNWQLLPSKVSGWVTLHSDMAPREWVWEFIHSDKVVIARTTMGIDAEGNKLEIECDMETTVLKDGLYRTRLTKTWTGRVGVRNRKTRKMEWSDNPVYPVAIDPDVSEEITADADDGHEVMLSWNYTSISFGYGMMGMPPLTPGWIFDSVAITNAKALSLANFKINQTGYGSPDAYGNIFGWDVDTATAFGMGTFPSTVTRTTASTSLPGTGSTGQRTFDVTTIVEEITERAGWATGNNLSLVGISGYTNQYNYQTFSDYPDSGNHGRLEVDYAGGGGGPAALPPTALDLFSSSIIQGN